MLWKTLLHPPVWSGGRGGGACNFNLPFLLSRGRHAVEKLSSTHLCGQGGEGRGGMCTVMSILVHGSCRGTKAGSSVMNGKLRVSISQCRKAAAHADAGSSAHSPSHCRPVLARAECQGQAVFHLIRPCQTGQVGEHGLSGNLKQMKRYIGNVQNKRR